MSSSEHNILYVFYTRTGVFLKRSKMQAGLRTINCVLAMKRRENEPEQMA